MAKFWTSQELSLILTKSSPHVRYLLWELFVKDEVPKENLESKPVALAIVQRLCRSKGKDSLVLSQDNGNGAHYMLNPDYLEDFKNLLSRDIAPEKPKPKPKKPKPVINGIVSTKIPDTASGNAGTRGRNKRAGGSRKRKEAADSELDLPLSDKTDLQFWFEFIRKINTKSGIELTIVSNGESASLKIP